MSDNTVSKQVEKTIKIIYDRIEYLMQNGISKQQTNKIGYVEQEVMDSIFKEHYKFKTKKTILLNGKKKKIDITTVKLSNLVEGGNWKIKNIPPHFNPKKEYQWVDRMGVSRDLKAELTNLNLRYIPFFNDLTIKIHYKIYVKIDGKYCLSN
jgi:hypothetical protein